MQISRPLGEAVYQADTGSGVVLRIKASVRSALHHRPMHLTLKTDYALRLIIAAPRPGEPPMSLSDIAAVLKISRNHLHKVAQDLTSMGVLESLPGRFGGVRLLDKALTLSVGDVVRHTEPQGLVSCLQETSSRQPCVLDQGCSLKSLLKRAELAFVQELDAVQLAQLKEESHQTLLRIGFGPRPETN